MRNSWNTKQIFSTIEGWNDGKMMKNVMKFLMEKFCQQGAMSSSALMDMLRADLLSTGAQLPASNGKMLQDRYGKLQYTLDD
jgi:hypothetical protein